jgi:hypothetical protein
MPIGVNMFSEHVILERWSIRETEAGARHFVGFSIVDNEGRVSTPILTFDPDSRTGTTSSGSTYTLVGRAGSDKDAEYVWRHAARTWKVEKWRDVTPELAPDWRMWLPRTERAALGDDEGDVFSHWEMASELVNTCEIYRTGFFRYRAIGYIGQHDEVKPNVEPVSVISGSGSVEFFRPVPEDSSLKLLIAMRVLLAKKMSRNESTDEIPFASPCMTVTLESAASTEDAAIEHLARLDIAIEGNNISGQLMIRDQPLLTFGPMRRRRHDDLWAMTLWMLPDWGDVGLVSCWDVT